MKQTWKVLTFNSCKTTYEDDLRPASPDYGQYLKCFDLTWQLFKKKIFWLDDCWALSSHISPPPPPCFTVSMRCFCWNTVAGFLQTWFLTAELWTPNCFKMISRIEVQHFCFSKTIAYVFPSWHCIRTHLDASDLPNDRTFASLEVCTADDSLLVNCTRLQLTL